LVDIVNPDISVAFDVSATRKTAKPAKACRAKVIILTVLTLIFTGNISSEFSEAGYQDSTVDWSCIGQ
jgi:hypothetical protein